EKCWQPVLASVAAGEITNWCVERPDGRVISVTNRPMPGGTWIATHEDITERRRAEARIEYLAHHDALTGLPNRMAFNERLTADLEHATRANQKFALLCIDL